MNNLAIRVRFHPSGREAYVAPNAQLLDAAAAAGIILDAPCGGQGLCGKCRIRIVADETPSQRPSEGTISHSARARREPQNPKRKRGGPRKPAA